MAVNVNLGVMVLNIVDANSGMFFGENAQHDWHVSNKINTACIASGYQVMIKDQINFINDTDLFDMMVSNINNNLSPAPAILKVV